MSNVYMVGSGALTLDIVEKIINENMWNLVRYLL